MTPKQQASKVGATRKRAKTGGRVAGTPNKATKALKDMILGALEDAGGQAYLVRQARKKNAGPFLALIAKVLPTTIDATVDVSTDRAEQMRRRREARLAQG